MKRNYCDIPLGASVRLVALLISSLLFGCSNLSNRKSLFGSSDPSSKAAVSETVAKEQYDQLMAKYKALLRSSGMGAGENIQADPLFNAKDPAEMVDKLSRANGSAELAETVDVFKGGMPPGGQVSLGNAASGNYSDKEIEQQIKILHEASSLVNQHKHGRAVNLLKGLETSGVDQIRVHAKFLLGELLFQQESYDLAMQIFEDIIKTHAFSGLVIKTLGRLIVCCNKLKLTKKRERYYSVLHDFFG